jgi:hypothetical protein
MHIEMPAELMLKYTGVISSANCIVEEVGPVQYSFRTKTWSTQVIKPHDDSVGYLVRIIGGDAGVNLIFFEFEHSTKRCYMGALGLKNDVLLGTCLTYFFVAAGAVLAGADAAALRNLQIYKTTREHSTRLCGIIRSQGFKLSPSWTTAGPTGLPPDNVGSVFQLLYISDTFGKVELWLGPAVPTADGFDTFIAVHHTRRFWQAKNLRTFQTVTRLFEEAGLRCYEL